MHTARTAVRGWMKMTRLIDADALIESMTKFSNATGEDMTHGIFYAHIAPTIDAIPIEFIEKRIAELKKLNEYEFIANGGYTSPSDYEQWELERLTRDWREQNEKTD